LKKIRVLVVDDSQLIRKLLTEILSSAPDIEVIGTAEDPYDARDKIKQLNPDVLTLDVEMPKMDGISFLRNLMRLRPMPVVMISTLTEKGAPATLDALELGAFDFVTKPQGGVWHELRQYEQEIQDKVRAAARANLSALDRLQRSQSAGPPGSTSIEHFRAGKVICIGSSTGGTEAVKKILVEMPKNCPPILITQHIPPTFSTTFARRLDSICQIRVHEAETGMVLLPGHAYLAPGDYHLGIRQQGTSLVTQVVQGEKVSGHRPSVDVMFDSVLGCVGRNTVAVLLTGMGADGAQAMLRIRQHHGETIVQDEVSSVVWGMPGTAVRLNAAQQIVPLDRIGQAILATCKGAG
jgi:two-component system, chemotaxis family, protein-glutamate methylesterase/glutaminase